MILNLAHRGFSGKYPENTMLAFAKALEAGADGNELDVHLSKDGELVVIHDELVDRTTDGSGLVADMTLEQLKKLDASAKFRGDCGVQRIPTLREYFEFIKDKDAVTNIELKTGVNPYPGIEEKTLALIDAYGLRDRVILSSFNHYSVMKFKAMAPEIPCGFLEESWMIGMAEYGKKHGVEGLHPVFCSVTEEFAREAREAGLRIHVWTVNTRRDMEEMIARGVDGIIGNYPDLCREVIGESGRK